jgi:hypothetical protein
MTAFTPEVTGTPRPRAFSTNSGSPVALVRTAWHHRDLIWQMTRREVLGRYRGSVLGLLWSFFSPLLMLTVYTFAFSYVFKMRVQGFPPTEAPPTAIFGVFAFTGLTLFTVMSESVARAPTLIQSNANLVKRVIFPLEILPDSRRGEFRHPGRGDRDHDRFAAPDGRRGAAGGPAAGAFRAGDGVVPRVAGGLPA